MTCAMIYHINGMGIDIIASYPGFPMFFNARKKNWEGLIDLVMY